VDAAAVQRVRERFAGRSDAWTEGELKVFDE
jgi:hypothetical protein